MAPDDQHPNTRRRAAIALTVVSFLLIIFAVTRLVASSDGAGTKGTNGSGASADNLLPSVALTAASDAAVSTDDLLGGPLVINFWYSACPPCANELKYFAAVDARYGDQVRFVGVNAIDSVEAMTEFAGERGVTYELYQDRLAELQTEMRLTAFPTTLFVAADGTIVERTGVLDEAGLEGHVLALIAATSNDG